MRGLSRRIRFLAVASVVAAAADLVTGGGPTYRPSVHALGWTPGGELVFVHQEETGGYDYRDYACGGSGVYVLRRWAPRPLVTGRAWCGDGDGVEGTFTLSPDGERLFAASEYSPDDCGTVRMMDLRRGAWSRFFRTCATSFSDAAVSPDGRALVARRTCSQRVGGGEPPRVLPAGCVKPADGRLRVFAADGTGERPIGGASYHDPVWSPDARSLLAVDHERKLIVHLDVATGAERVVARGSDPAWSPDGRWIAFIRREARPDRPGASLRVIRADGTGERTVFLRWYGLMWNLETRPNGIPQSPLWSPDGRRIVFARYHNRGHTLWRIDANGSGLRRLARPIEPGK